MGKIEKIIKKGPVEGQTTEVYPVTSTKAVYDENNKRLDTIITRLQESVYLNTPIPISTEDTPEANAQNVKNIADYVKKAKAAGITDVNGMAVTCIIDGGNSAVGYLYGEDVFVGILPYDDNSLYYVLISNGSYIERGVVIEGTTNQVTSNMLVKGARKPIILTPGTTEVDKETYQKLLSDDVDVVFKTSTGDTNLCTLTYKVDNGDYLSLYFTCFSIEGTADDTYIYAYEVRITKTSPHTCSITENVNGGLTNFIDNAGFLEKSVLNPVLQEIDLTGTNANRRAKLDQFAADWKTLTGASDLNGARFVGNVSMNDGALTNVLLSYDMDGNYSGISMSDDVDVFHLKKIVVHPNNGSVESASLFSHLEAITIYADNTNESKQKNIDNLNAYKTNLVDLGVDIDHKNFQIPVTIYDSYAGSLYYSSYDKVYVGVLFATDDGYGVYFIRVELDGTYSEVKFAFNEEVDTSMSDTSTNPVQNKVIKAYIDGLVGNVTAQLAQI